VPRRPRVVISGLPHHITQRGNNRQPVFYCDRDRKLYLDLLTRHALQYGAQILSYCLMTNHVHVVAIPEHDHSLARTFGRTHAEYAAALNHAERRSGHLWQNRFFSCPLDAAHLERAMRYVELNPVRAGLIAVPWDWPWSSARAHCSKGTGDVLLDFLCGGRPGDWDYAGWQTSLLSGLSDGETEAVRHSTETGAPLGSSEFLTELERKAGRRLRVWARGRPRKRPRSPDEAGSPPCLLADDAV
jgi:putative transposase